MQNGGHSNGHNKSVAIKTATIIIHFDVPPIGINLVITRTHSLHTYTFLTHHPNRNIWSSSTVWFQVLFSRTNGMVRFGQSRVWSYMNILTTTVRFIVRILHHSQVFHQSQIVTGHLSSLPDNLPSGCLPSFLGHLPSVRSSSFTSRSSSITLR